MNGHKILIKCAYAPNKNSTIESNNESSIFLKTVFEDDKDNNYEVKLMVGDYDVALSLDMVT